MIWAAYLRWRDRRAERIATRAREEALAEECERQARVMVQGALGELAQNGPTDLWASKNATAAALEERAAAHRARLAGDHAGAALHDREADHYTRVAQRLAKQGLIRVVA